MSQRVLYSLHGTSVLSFCTNVVLTLSISLITVTIVIILVNLWCCFICLFTYPEFSPYFTWDSVRSPINPGPVSLKEGLSMYGDFHYKDKTAVRQFCLYIGNFHTGKMASYIEKAPRPLVDTVIILAILFVAKVGQEAGPWGPKSYQIQKDMKLVTNFASILKFLFHFQWNNATQRQ